jgi:hypothetical protein
MNTSKPVRGEGIKERMVEGEVDEERRIEEDDQDRIHRAKKPSALRSFMTGVCRRWKAHW